MQSPGQHCQWIKYSSNLIGHNRGRLVGSPLSRVPQLGGDQVMRRRKEEFSAALVPHRCLPGHTGRCNCSPSFCPFATRTCPAPVNFSTSHARRMAPTKRTWDEANAGSDLDAASSLQGSSSGTAGRNGSQQSLALQNQGAARDAPSTSPAGAASASTSQHIPMISRKIRACASCRKHKVSFLTLQCLSSTN